MASVGWSKRRCIASTAPAMEVVGTKLANGEKRGSVGEGKKIRHSDGWLAIWTLFRYRFSRARWNSATPGLARPEAPFPVSFSRLAPE